MMRICLYFVGGAFLYRLVYKILVHYSSLIIRCRCFNCPNIGQVTLTLLVQGLIVSPVDFFVQQFWWWWTWAKLIQLVCIILLPVTQRPAENPCDRSGWHVNVVKEKSTARVSHWDNLLSLRCSSSFLCLSAVALLRDSGVPRSMYNVKF